MKTFFNVILFGAFWITQANAAVYYVNDPTTSIQSVIDTAITGDTILVGAGTYHENLNFDYKNISLVSISGAENTRITRKSDSIDSIITALAPSRVEGFTISGGLSDFGAGMRVGNGAVITNNIFENNYGLSGGGGSAIYANFSSPEITNNIFRNNAGDSQGGSAVITFSNPSSALVSNNIFYDNEQRAISIRSNGGSLVITNNTIVANEAALYLGSSFVYDSVVIANNIIYGNKTGVVSPDSYSELPELFLNNLISDNGVNFEGVPNVPGTNGNLALPPSFVDYANRDLHLTEASAAIGKGLSSYAPARDYDGVMRPVGMPSIGAYEYVSAASPVPEAESYAMMLVGLTFMGFIARRRVV